MFFLHFCVFWEPFGSLLASFWSLRRLFGVLVSFFWFSLACLSRLWALSATFCGACGSSGLSVGSGTAPGPFFGSFFGDFGVISERFGGVILKPF